MGLLSGLGGALGAFGGLNGGMGGLLPMLMQQKQQEKPTGLQAGMQNLANDPFLGNNISMMTTGQPQLGGMGGGPPPPQGGPMGGGMAGAFSNNPQFQQQLQTMMSQQSPGFQGAQMQQPQMPVGTTPQQSGGARNMRGALFGNPLNNYGSQGDPSQYFMNLLGRSQG